MIYYNYLSLHKHKYFEALFSVVIAVASLYAAVTYHVEIERPATCSEWVSELPAGISTDDYEIESKSQFRSRVRETKISTDSNLSDWSLYNTTLDWTEYGPWTGWSTTPAYDSDTVKADSKIQYRYRDKISTRETTYTVWSDWQDTPITPSSTIEVETQQVVDYVEKIYSYGAYFPNNNYPSATWTHFCDICAQKMYGGTWTYKKFTQYSKAKTQKLNPEQYCDHCGEMTYEYIAEDGIHYYCNNKAIRQSNPYTR